MIEFGGKKIIYNAGYESTMEYNDRSQIKKRTPKVQLLCTPFFAPFVPIELISQDFGGLIQSMQFVKSRSMAGGTCTITVAGDESKIRGIEKYSSILADIWKTSGADFRDIFRPMAYCQVWYNGFSLLSGVVKSCHRIVRPGNVTYSITIDELGNILQNNILSLDTILFGDQMHLIGDPSQILSASGTLSQMPAYAAIQTYVLAYLASTMSMGGQYFRMSDGLPLSFRMIALPPPIGCISSQMLLSQFATDGAMFQTSSGGSFWDFLRSLLPNPFIEIFTESGGRTMCTGRIIGTEASAFTTLSTLAFGIAPVTLPVAGIGASVLLPGMNYVVVRTAPYDVPWIGITPWMPLLYNYMLGILDMIMSGDFVIITDDDVIEKDLGQDGEQQYTIFRTSMGGREGSNAEMSMYRPSVARGPLSPFHPGGTRTFGMKEYTASFPAYTMLDTGIAGAQLEKSEKSRNVPALSTLLNSWFRNVSKFNEGSVMTRSIPYARPGMYLLYLPSLRGGKVDNVRDLGAYYIDNVQHSFVLGKADTTTFSLIRGVPIPMRLASLSKMLFDWEILPPGMNLFDGVF